MMDQASFDILSQELFSICDSIPRIWGCMEGTKNNSYAQSIGLFSAKNLYELNSLLNNLNKDDTFKTYLKRKWFMFKCSRCDEYLFSKHPNVTPNTVEYDKIFDFKVKNCLYDLKSTRIPEGLSASFYTNVPDALAIKLFSDQSTGVRFGVQNRLFVIQHSFVNLDNENRLRTSWGLREKAFRYFCDNIDFVSKFPCDVELQDGTSALVYASFIYIEEYNSSIDIIIPGLQTWHTSL